MIAKTAKSRINWVLITALIFNFVLVFVAYATIKAAVVYVSVLAHN